MEAQIDTGADHCGGFFLSVRVDDHERELHPPVGSVRGVGDPRQAGEIDILLGGRPAEHALRLGAKTLHLVQVLIKRLDRRADLIQKPQRLGIIVGASLHLAQTLAQQADQGLAALGIGQQIIL